MRNEEEMEEKETDKLKVDMFEADGDDIVFLVHFPLPMLHITRRHRPPHAARLHTLPYRLISLGTSVLRSTSHHIVSYTNALQDSYCLDRR